MEKDAILNGIMPKHIAIILDGNGRWAKKRGLPRTVGHYNGLNNLSTIAEACDSYGIKALTVYAFSTENWNRPDDEVDYLMKLPSSFLSKKLKKIASSNIKICFLGRKDRFPKKTLEAINKIIDSTKDHTGLVLNVCFDYGSRYELLEAFKKMHEDLNQGNLKMEDLSENTIANYLYTKDCPELDLLIRTSGELRISNYLLYQLAYAELYFTDVLWPDFNEEELLKAIESFQKRNRRFGGLEAKK